MTAPLPLAPPLTVDQATCYRVVGHDGDIPAELAIGWDRYHKAWGVDLSKKYAMFRFELDQRGHWFDTRNRMPARFATAQIAYDAAVAAGFVPDIQNGPR